MNIQLQEDSHITRLRAQEDIKRNLGGFLGECFEANVKTGKADVNTIIMKRIRNQHVMRLSQEITNQSEKE